MFDNGFEDNVFAELTQLVFRSAATIMTFQVRKVLGNQPLHYRIFTQ